MKWKFLFQTLLTLTALSCNSSKNIALSKGEVDEAIHSAITDFLHYKGKLVKNYSVFSVYVVNVNADVFEVGISGERDKIALFTRNEIDYDYRFFPTRFYEHKNKFFYWKDSTVSVSGEIIKKFYSLNRVDTVIYQKKFPERSIDERQKVVHYYFCRKDLNKYKKRLVSVSMKKYKVPRVSCKP